jgi:hypothetical protein
MTVTFDPIHYKDTTRAQWEDAASAWHGTGSCIKAKGVLTSHQSGEAGPSSAVENRNNQAFKRLLRGFWASKRARLGRPIA